MKGEHNKGIESDEADLHRQVDAKGFVFASRKALSIWGVAPPSSRGLTAGAYQNSTQLESSGLIARSATSSKPLAVEYSLTQPGKTIIPPLRGMCRWPARG